MALSNIGNKLRGIRTRVLYIDVNATYRGHGFTLSYQSTTLVCI